MKCNECGAKIQYNQFKRYRKKVLCYGCYDTRLERKAAKKAARRNVAMTVKLDKELEGYNPFFEAKEDA